MDSGPKTGSTVPLVMPGVEVGDMNTPATSSGGGGDRMEQKWFHSDELVETTPVMGLNQ